MSANIKLMRVESGKLSFTDAITGEPIGEAIDVHSRLPNWWLKIERLLRLDLALSLNAKFAEKNCDVVWAASEKVGIPLSLLGLQKPLVVIAHHMSSPTKARFARLFGLVNKWSGIGFISDEGKDFLIDYFNVHPDKLFQYEASKYLSESKFIEVSYTGPIMSAGVAKRDYNTLIKALTHLPGYETELFTSSKFGDQLQHQLGANIPPWVNVKDWIPETELVQHYQNTRFVVVPLHRTTHSGAGINAVLEASAFGKAVIATKTGGMTTFVKDGETGILVSPYDAPALQKAIEILWTQPHLAKQMGSAGQRFIESRFDPVEVNLRISKFIKKLHANHYSSKTP